MDAINAADAAGAADAGDAAGAADAAEVPVPGDEIDEVPADIPVPGDEEIPAEVDEPPAKEDVDRKVQVVIMYDEAATEMKRLERERRFSEKLGMEDNDDLIRFMWTYCKKW